MTRLRIAALFAIAGACGRIGFDARLAGDDGGGPGDDDAKPPATYYFTSSTGVGPSTLFTIDLASGVLVSLGTMPGTFGELDGLAYWDANTLYATAYQGQLVEIHLSPFSANVIFTFGSARLVALARDGNVLLGLDDLTDGIFRFDPTATVPTLMGPVALTPSLDVSGGGMAHVSGTQWVYYSNATFQLYQFDSVTGNRTTIGGDAAMPYLTGLVITDTGLLFGTSRLDNQLCKISQTDGTISSSSSLCVGTPGCAPYDFDFGDLTRTP